MDERLGTDMKTGAITKNGLLLPFGTVPGRPTCYLVSAAAVCFGYLIRLALDPLLGDKQPYVFFCAAIAIGGWYGRLGAMLLATVLGLLIGNYAFVTPRYHFRIFSLDQEWLAGALGYLFVAGSIIVVTRAMHSSARKAAEASRKLRETEQQFRLHFELAPIGAVQCTPEGRFLWMNRAYCAITGYSCEELSDMTFYEITHPEDRASNRELVEQLMSGRRHEFLMEKRYVRKDGAIVWLEVAVSVLRDEGGRPERMLAFVQDVTERKNAEQSLRATTEELDRKVQERTARLQETIAELEAFSYSLSHDLRAPLRAMEGFSNLLISDFGDKLGPTGAEYLERISRAAQRMDSLIQDVLTYHRLVRQEMKLETVDVEQLLAQIVAEQPQFQPPQALIEICHPLLKVRGHTASLTQCIFNLLGNAVKFVAPGTQARVRVWSEPKGSFVRLWFEDNGIGIGPDNQERIFGMFQRLHANHEYAGTGIGLAIVRKAAERMGGQVGVVSQPGKGSRFWLELEKAG